MRIMGIDCSSTTIGYGIVELLGDKIVFVDAGFYKPPKAGNIFCRLSETQRQIRSLLKKYQIDRVAVEEFMKFFKNRSSAQTITQLAVFNRVVGLAVYNYLGVSPDLLSVITIRHAVKTSKKVPSKEEIPDLVAQHLGIDFPWQLNKKGKIKTENYDVADAMAVALTLALKLKQSNDSTRSL